MRLLFIPLHLIVLILLIMPAVSLHAEGPIPPHKDPASISGSFKNLTLLMYLNNSLQLMAESNFKSASDLLGAVTNANMPKDMKFIGERSANLFGELNDALASANKSLKRSRELIALNQKVKALERLNTVEEDLAQAVSLLEGTTALTKNLGNNLGVFNTVESSPLQTAYQSMTDVLKILKGLTSEYTKTKEQLISISQTPGETLGTDVPLNPRPYSTSMIANLPRKSYPGLPLSLKGTVFSPDGPTPDILTVEIFLADKSLGIFTSPPNFSGEVKIPENTMLGIHTIRFKVVAEQPHNGTELNKQIEILQVPVKLIVDHPKIAFFSPNLPVSGQIVSNFGVPKDAKVTVQIGQNITEIRSDKKGRFYGSVNLPLTILLLGTQTIRVTVDPNDPWYQTTSSESSVLVINYYASGVAFLTAGYLLFIGIWKWRHSPAGNLPSNISSGFGYTSSPTDDLLPDSEIGLQSTTIPVNKFIDPSSIQGQIVSCYFSTVIYLQTNRETYMKPSYTLRDFLVIMNQEIDSPFAGLTTLTERALYNHRNIQNSDLDEAKRLASMVTKETD